MGEVGRILRGVRIEFEGFEDAVDLCVLECR